MRLRVTIATLATVIGLTLLARFKTPAQLSSLSAGSRQVAQQSRSTEEDSEASSDDGAGTSNPAPSTSPSTSATKFRNGRFTGEDFQTQFGDNQVRVVISGGRIIDVQAIQLPYDRERSQYISSVAGPMLRDEALQTQSAQIDTISGATYTSEAYARSLQSALDQARA